MPTPVRRSMAIYSRLEQEAIAAEIRLCPAAARVADAFRKDGRVPDELMVAFVEAYEFWSHREALLGCYLSEEE